MKKIFLSILGLLAAVFIVIQFVPVEARTNPPVESDISAPPEVDAILRRSCYDCHSHETKWPWYNRVAPASWLIAHDVEEAREHLNFSTWDRYSSEEKAHLLEEMWEEVEEGEMPLWFYVPLHPEAELSEADMKTLEDWATRAAKNQEIKADVEDAVGDFLDESEKELEDAAEDLMKASERTRKEAQDAFEDTMKAAEDAAEE